MAGNRVQELREGAKLTPDELGDVVGESGPAIEQYEAGDAIPLRVAEKLAATFAVPVAFLRGDD